MTHAGLFPRAHQLMAAFWEGVSGPLLNLQVNSKPGSHVKRILFSVPLLSFLVQGIGSKYSLAWSTGKFLPVYPPSRYYLYYQTDAFATPKAEYQMCSCSQKEHNCSVRELDKSIHYYGVIPVMTEE